MTCFPWFRISSLTKLPNQSYHAGGWVDATKSYWLRTAIDTCVFGKERLIEANDRLTRSKLGQGVLRSFIQISLQIGSGNFLRQERSFLLKAQRFIHKVTDAYVHGKFC